MSEIVRNSFLVSALGGTLDFVSSDGEVLLSVAVPPGMIDANPYMAIAPVGSEVQVSDGLVCVPPRGQPIRALAYGKGSHESGANPDFEPTSASHQQFKLEAMVSQLATQAVERSRAAMLASISQVEVIPTNPAPEAQSEVVEQ